MNRSSDADDKPRGMAMAPLNSEAARNPAAVGTGLRAAVVGAPRALTGAVRRLPVDDGLRPDGPHGPRHLDVVLCDESVHPPTDVAGTPLVIESVTGAHDPTERPGGDRTIMAGPGAAGGPWPYAAADTSVLNPIGVKFEVDGAAVVYGSGGGTRIGEVVARARASVDADVVLAVDGDADGAAHTGVDAARLDVSGGPSRRAARLRRHLGVVDDPGLHADPAARAAWLVELACAGVPVALLDDEGLDAEVAGRLGAGLVAALQAASIADLCDPLRRDRVGVAQRRAALREHHAERAWRAIAAELGVRPIPAPTVSVLLATNRPERLLAATARFAAFSHPHRELVVALHGSAFDGGVHDPTIGRHVGGDALDRHLTELAGAPTTVLRVGDDLPLGAVLDEAAWAASGDLVTKLDDDDRYDVHHLDDLVDALRYTNAEIVGKGSEFVHLGEIHVTIRRLPNGAESSSRTVAGGTLILGRDTLRSVGGWQHAPRSVDQLLIDDVLQAGGRLHRTHGYGFVLDRHVDGHTWATATDTFLRRAVAQWPGLALEAAGFSRGDPGAAYLHGDAEAPDDAMAHSHAGPRGDATESDDADGHGPLGPAASTGG